MRIINIAEDYARKIRDERDERERERKINLGFAKAEYEGRFLAVFAEELPIFREAGIEWTVKGSSEGSLYIELTKERSPYWVRLNVDEAGRYNFNAFAPCDSRYRLMLRHSKETFLAYVAQKFKMVAVEDEYCSVCDDEWEGNDDRK